MATGYTAENNAIDIKELETRVHALERDSDENKKAHKEIYNRMETESKERVIVSTQYSFILSKMESMDKKIDEMKNVPGKRWESIITTAITSVTGGLVVAVMALIMGGGGA